MKKLFYLLVFIVAACNQSNKTSEIHKVTPVTKIIRNTPIVFIADKLKRQVVADSLIIPEDALYINLKPVFSEISKVKFESLKRNYKGQCALGKGSFIKDSGIDMISSCNDICETYLAERNTNRKMLLPSGYDQGILAMPISPNCTKLLVCSSYDGPVNEEGLYGHRTEFYIFNITAGIGLKGIKPAFKYYSNDWSIDDLTWVDDKTIALKTYIGSKAGDTRGLTYRYFKADVSK